MQHYFDDVGDTTEQRLDDIVNMFPLDDFTRHVRSLAVS